MFIKKIDSTRTVEVKESTLILAYVIIALSAELANLNPEIITFATNIRDSLTPEAKKEAGKLYDRYLPEDGDDYVPYVSALSRDLLAEKKIDVGSRIKFTVEAATTVNVYIESICCIKDKAGMRYEVKFEGFGGFVGTEEEFLARVVDVIEE